MFGFFIFGCLVMYEESPKNGIHPKCPSTHQANYLPALLTSQCEQPLQGQRKSCELSKDLSHTDQRYFEYIKLKETHSASPNRVKKINSSHVGCCGFW